MHLEHQWEKKKKKLFSITGLELHNLKYNASIHKGNPYG